MAKRLGPPIMLGVFTILAIVLLTGTSSNDELEEIFEIEATYDESGSITVTYSDKSKDTASSVLQVLGMKESFQKTITGNEFVETVPFPNPPQNGWKAHPIVLDIDHAKLGHVQLKTEVYNEGESVPPVIYSQP